MPQSKPLVAPHLALHGEAGCESDETMERPIPGAPRSHDLGRVRRWIRGGRGDRAMVRRGGGERGPLAWVPGTDRREGRSFALGATPGEATGEKCAYKANLTAEGCLRALVVDIIPR